MPDGDVRQRHFGDLHALLDLADARNVPADGAGPDGLDLDARVNTAQSVMRIDDGLGQAVIEPLVHAWDLATATGRDLVLPDHLVTPLLAALEPVEGLLRSSGMFAGRRPVPAGPPAQQRLLALLGRRC